MSDEDARKIEKQVEELLRAKLVEEYKGQEYPRFCSPTFLVPKVPNTKRMVGDYRKLNQRTLPHAGFLPDLEATVERIAATRIKTKMDMRSGF